jgi:glutamyl-tRNA reductase
MTFIACGINHKTTPIEIREKISPTPEKQHELLLELMQEPYMHGAVMLATCNRTEIYCDTDQSSHILPWFAERHALPYSLLNNYAYLHKADEGLKHVMRVACGLDSMVLGEPQILGQMKQAYHQADQMGTLNSPLQHIFRHVFNASKKVRTQTSIGTYPVSVAFTAVHLIRKVFKELNNAHVLLIGSGDTATLVAKHLKNQGVKHFYVASRNLEHAQKAAAPLSGESLTISQIPDYVPKADIIITATQCPLPFIGKEMVASALETRQDNPLFIFDLAVPRDVEANVHELMNVFLYNVDDLQSIANEGLEERQQASLSAEQIIEDEVNFYLLQERGKKARHAICRYRKYAKSVRAQELLKAQKELERGLPPLEVLEKMSHRLTKKLLHRPSLQLRQAAFEERHDFLEYTSYLYEN